MAGRKRTPTELKIITARPGRVGINKNEPQPPGNLLEPPEWMTDSQKAVWTYAIENCPLGMLRRLDLSTLQTWAVAVDAHREAAQKIAQFGMLTKTSETNPTPMQSPYLQVLNKQAQIILRAVQELGFSPVSRTRLSYAPVGDAQAADPAERFFRKVNAG